MSDAGVLVRVHGVKTPEQVAWLAIAINKEEDSRQVRIDIDPSEAVKRDATSFMHELTDAQAKVIKSEIVGGILMGRKQLKSPGMTVRLLYLGGSNGDSSRVAEVSSVAFAVAAHVAVIYCLGNDEERADARGGFGWRVETIDTL